MTLIKCKCGNEFSGQEDKEDTCPDCLKKLIEPKLKLTIEVKVRKASLGYKKDGTEYLAGKITSNKLTKLINKKVKLTIEEVK